MPSTSKSYVARTLGYVIALAAVFASVDACGRIEKPVKVPPRANALPAGSTELKLPLTPSALPAMATMPPPGVRGSRKATKKTDAALFACGGGAEPSAIDPVARVRILGESCEAVSKMKPLGPMIRGQQADHDAHEEHATRVEAGHCYRIVFAVEEGVKSAVLVMRDSTGEVVEESAGAALPADGTLCFTSSDDVTWMIAVGAGKGAYAAQMWTR